MNKIVLIIGGVIMLLVMVFGGFHVMRMDTAETTTPTANSATLFAKRDEGQSKVPATGPANPPAQEAEPVPSGLPSDKSDASLSKIMDGTVPSSILERDASGTGSLDFLRGGKEYAAPEGDKVVFAKSEKDKTPAGSLGRNFQRVMAYASKEIPESWLFAVDGITDGGGVPQCFPPNDGWAYYFLTPAAKKNVRGKDVYTKERRTTIWECKGDIGIGSEGYVWARPKRHHAVDANFIDSHKALAILAERSGQKIPEKSKITMRLSFHKKQPFPGQKFLWEIRLRPGDRSYWVDALHGSYLGRGQSYEVFYQDKIR